MNIIIGKIRWFFVSIYETIKFFVTFPFVIRDIMADKDLNVIGAIEYHGLQLQHEIDRLEIIRAKELAIQKSNRKKIYKAVIKIMKEKGYM